MLAIDPVGQGERFQYWDPDVPEAEQKWGTREHSYEGLQCTLIGSSVTRYFIWDGMRGIDYLISREEVDAERIGVTGNSGGGTQTTLLMMADPRIHVAVPCCYVTSRETYMKTGQSQDAEQIVFGSIREGLNYDDYLTCFAPKPVRIGAAAYDYFCIEGVYQTYERARQVYRHFKAEEKIGLAVVEATHGFSPGLREACVNWFKHHLNGEEPDFRTGEIPAEVEEDLNCTGSGQVLMDRPSAPTVFDLNLQELERRRLRRPRIADKQALEDWVRRMRSEVSEVLALPQGRGPILPRVISTQEIDGLLAEKIFFFSEPDVVLTAIGFAPSDLREAAPATLLLLENGTEGIADEEGLIRKLTSEGRRILVLDVRGIGGVKARSVNPRGVSEIYGSEFKLNCDAMMMGMSLIGLRVFDVLRGYDYLTSRRDVDAEQIDLHAKGLAALYGFFAGVLEEGLRTLVFEDMLYSYESVVATKDYYCDHRILVHGILEHFDLVDLLPCFEDREYQLIRPRNARDEIVSPEEWKRNWLDVVETSYPILGETLSKTE